MSSVYHELISAEVDDAEYPELLLPGGSKSSDIKIRSDVIKSNSEQDSPLAHPSKRRLVDSSRSTESKKSKAG